MHIGYQIRKFVMEEWLAVSSMAADKPRPLLQNSLVSNNSKILVDHEIDSKFYSLVLIQYSFLENSILTDFHGNEAKKNGGEGGA